MSVAEAGDWVVFSRGETSSVGAKLKTQAESHMMPIKFTAESFLRLITLAPDILEPQNGPGDPLQAGSHAQKLVEFTVVFRFPRAMRLSAGRHCVSPMMFVYSDVTEVQFMLQFPSARNSGNLQRPSCFSACDR
jgi:hypothetical protein